MQNYIKELFGDNIIFKNLSDGTELIIKHYDDKSRFDSICIKDNYDINFIEYVIDELKNTNDIKALFSLYDSKELEKLLQKKGLKILSYQYRINYKNKDKVDNYNIDDILNKDSKKYYLNKLNDFQKINCKYYNPNFKYTDFDEKWFDNDEFEYRVYKQNNKIIGIVDFRKPIKETDYNNSEDIFIIDDKLYIRYIFAEKDTTIEDIIRDLLYTFKTDIIFNVHYTNNQLKNIIKKLDGEFDYCAYTLIDNS